MLAIIIFLTVATGTDQGFPKKKRKPTNQPITPPTPDNCPFQVVRDTGFLHTAMCLSNKVQFLNQHNRGPVWLSSQRMGCCPAACVWLDCCVVGMRERSLCWPLIRLSSCCFEVLLVCRVDTENRLMFVLWKWRLALSIP